MVSDVQGNTERDLIVFIKYLMTAKESCMELHEKIPTITTP